LELREYVDAEALVALTSALVSVPTENPPGNERALADILREALDPYGPQWTEIEPAPGRLSLVARVAGGDGAPASARSRGAGGPAGGEHGAGVPVLVVNGHTDVVPAIAAGWTRDPFQPVVVDGRLYGRGSADMKGGVASAIAALGALKAAGLQPSCDIVFQFVADEERGGALGTRALLEAGLLQGDACLVPEPTALAVSVAERGLLQGEIVLRGRPGHGSRPREGVSATEMAARVTLALHAADFGDPDHPLLGRPTANIGTLHGGTAVNVVAEQARVGFDRRLLPGVSQQDAVEAIRHRLAAEGLDGLDYEIVVTDFGEGSEMSPEHPFAALVRRCVASATGRSPDAVETVGMTFTTDARFMRNQAGMPAVVCGPGAISQAHGVDEWVEVAQLVSAAAAYAELFRSFGPFC
jgi:acetylornithine deacetylase/succinyl-diaminopimelate desuccinylase